MTREEACMYLELPLCESAESWMQFPHLNGKELEGLFKGLKVECLCESGKVYGKFMPGLHIHLTTQAVWKHAEL